MLQEHDGLTEGLTSQIVDRHPPIIEMAVRDVLEVCGDEPLNNIEVLADSQRADLLVITDHYHPLSEVASNERHHVTLTRLVDDDDIETRGSRIELLHYPSQRHDPHGHRIPALIHQPGGLDPKLRGAPAGAAADSPDRIGPSDQRLALTQADARRLRSPCLTIDEIGRRPAQLSG